MTCPCTNAPSPPPAGPPGRGSSEPHATTNTAKTVLPNVIAGEDMSRARSSTKVSVETGTNKRYTRRERLVRDPKSLLEIAYYSLAVCVIACGDAGDTGAEGASSGSSSPPGGCYPGEFEPCTCDSGL